MAITLDKDGLKKLIKGASLFTTGGGVPTDDQIKTIDQLKNPKVRLLSLSEFPKDGFLVTAGEIGPANAPQIEKEHIVKEMHALLERVSGKKIVGIYPPEIGQESVVIETAHFLNLPIADFDPSGFRAVPYLDINVFNLLDLPFSFSPLVLSTDKKEFLVVSTPLSYERTEKVLREMTSLSTHGILFFFGGMVSVKTLLTNKLENNSMSTAFSYGSLTSLNELKEKTKPLQVVSGTVKKITEKEKKGFLFQQVTLSGNDKKSYQLVILNEVMFLFQGEKMLASIPKRMLLIDTKKLTGIPSGDLKVGTTLSVFVLAPEKAWEGKKAEKLFGKERFKELL